MEERERDICLQNIWQMVFSLAQPQVNNDLYIFHIRSRQNQIVSLRLLPIFSQDFPMEWCAEVYITLYDEIW